MSKKPSGAPRKPRTKAGVPGASGNAKTPGKGDNSKNLTPDEERQLFLNHRRKWLDLTNKVKVAERLRDDMLAEARQDGFLKKHFQIADDLATTKGESKIKGEVGARIQVAAWIGHPLGRQLDLFAKATSPVQTVTSVDRAFDEGKQASMENRPAKPNDEPGTPAHEAYMRGFHEHQATIVRGGIKTPDPDAPPTAH